MKIILKDEYEYLGQWGKFHAFRSLRSDYDPEIILEFQVEVRDNNNNIVGHYHPIKFSQDNETDIFRVREAIYHMTDVSLDVHVGKENTSDKAGASIKRLATYSHMINKLCAASGTVNKN
jgi:metallophosphoesterase superfamily enzyme